MRNQNLWWATLILLVIALTTGCAGDAPTNYDDIVKRGLKARTPLEIAADMAEEDLRNVGLPATLLTRDRELLFLISRTEETLVVEDVRGDRKTLTIRETAEKAFMLVGNKNEHLNLPEVLFEFWRAHMDHALNK